MKFGRFSCIITGIISLIALLGCSSPALDPASPPKGASAVVHLVKVHESSGCGAAGCFNSLAIIADYPAIAYSVRLDADEYALYYVRAQDPSGESWNEPVKVTNGRSRVNSLLVAEGRPAIAVDRDGQLCYVRAEDDRGATWGEVHVIDPLAGASSQPSMAIVDGNPAVAYVAQATDDVMYIRASNPKGTEWFARELVFDDHHNITAVSLAQTAAGPGIAVDAMDSKLVYILALDLTGTAWRAPKVLDALGHTGGFACQRLVNGIPAIAYGNWTDGDLFYLSACKPAPFDWNPRRLAAGDASFLGTHSSLAQVGGRPAVCYLQDGSYDLIYRRATNSLGDFTFAPRIQVDTNYPYLCHTSLIEVKSGAGLAYAKNGTLIYAWIAD